MINKQLYDLARIIEEYREDTSLISSSELHNMLVDIGDRVSDIHHDFGEVVKVVDVLYKKINSDKQS
jgi:hypothetical protein